MTWQDLYLWLVVINVIMLVISFGYLIYASVAYLIPPYYVTYVFIKLSTLFISLWVQLNCLAHPKSDDIFMRLGGALMWIGTFVWIYGTKKYNRK